VLAEAFRAGIRSVPSGQSEAAYAVGMRKSQVMQHILVPQAARAMLPVIVSQLVVLVKDTALGYIIGYTELLQSGVANLSANYGNAVAAAIVVGIIYILLNASLTAFAGWLERRTRRAGKAPKAPGAGGVVGPAGQQMGVGGTM
jgi:glutamate transport system permease protein